MGVADTQAVFRLEFRRYLRWRPLRRWLYGWTLLSVLLATGALLLIARGEAFQTLGGWGRVLLGLLYVSPTWAGFSSTILLTQRIARDATRRGELHDLYLTALSPFAIGFGKVAACWALTGILMAAAAPASALAAFLMGAPLGRWLSALLIGWVALFWVCGAVYRCQWRVVPPLESVRLYPVQLSSVAAALTGLGLITLTLSVGMLSTNPLPSTTPIFHLLPWGAMLYADALYPTPAGQVPAWAFLTLFSLLSGLVFTVAGAQWLGGWSLWGYRFQRIVGGALLIATATLCFTTIAPWAVFHPRSGERLFFWGMFVCLLIGILLTRYVLGYYGMGRGQDAFRPLSGFVREWILFGILMAAVAWAIQAGSGVALNGARLAALGCYLGGWLYLVQWLSATLSTRIQTRRLMISIAGAKFTKTSETEDPLLQVPPASRGNRTGARLGSPREAGGTSRRGAITNSESAIGIRSIGQNVIAEIGILPQQIGFLISMIWIPIMILREPILRQVFYYPLLITPLGGFLSLDFPTWAYWVYGLYTALFGVALSVSRKQAATQATG